jgi:hypothetical protein
MCRPGTRRPNEPASPVSRLGMLTLLGSLRVAGPCAAKAMRTPLANPEMTTIAITVLSLILSHKMSIATSEASQRHHALIRLIRYTGALIAGASALMGCVITALIALAVCRAQPLDFIAILALLLLILSVCGVRRTGIILAVIFAVSGCYFLGCLILTTIRGQPQFSNFGWLGRPLLVLGSLALVWLLGFMFRAFALKGYDMWRRIDQITVADFASVFALFAARVFHYFLPSHLPQTVNDHLWVGFRDPFSDRGGRMLWTWLALYLFYRLTKSYLFRLFGLNGSTPQAPTSLPPDETNRPSVPFDPYDLSRNSPPYAGRDCFKTFAPRISGR